MSLKKDWNNVHMQHLQRLIIEMLRPRVERIETKQEEGGKREKLAATLNIIWKA